MTKQNIIQYMDPNADKLKKQNSNKNIIQEHNVYKYNRIQIEFSAIFYQNKNSLSTVNDNKPAKQMH